MNSFYMLSLSLITLWLKSTDFHLFVNKVITALNTNIRLARLWHQRTVAALWGGSFLSISRPHGSGSPSAAPIVARHQARTHRALFTKTATSTLVKKLLHTKCADLFFFSFLSDHILPVTASVYILPFCSPASEFTEQRRVNQTNRAVTVKTDLRSAALWPRMRGAVSGCMSVYLFAHESTLGDVTCSL